MKIQIMYKSLIERPLLGYESFREAQLLFTFNSNAQDHDAYVRVNTQDEISRVSNSQNLFAY